VKPLSVVLAGAPLDTGNRGVEALGRSVVEAIDLRAEASGCSGRDHLTVLDNGWGVRREGSGHYVNARVELVGVRLSRRWYRPESWTQVRVDQVFGSRLNPVARRIRQADALLDISGGDSFADLYGARRLASVSAPKEAALRADTPLVLLPQTYGPFDTAEGLRRANGLVRRSALAYARDPLSHRRLLELAGRDADTSRCRQGVDVAFALRPREPALPRRLRALLDDESTVTAGVNVSGLLRPDSARERFRLAGDYLATMTTLTRALIANGAFVVFVPHVHVPGGHGESDVAAIQVLRNDLTTAEGERTVVLPPELGADELKWCMEHLNWMVGSRMHSTIGSLSRQIPTFGYAYSDKTAGVFETCGVRDEVADAREVAGEQAVELIVASFARRDRTAETLAKTIPAVVGQARGQLAEILDTVESWKTGAPVGSIGR
jgi:colanic acid/amylovoran biosynthesis protein WcaK/AmsJ